jgi:hypothetical protein
VPCHRFTELERRRTGRVRACLTDRRKVAWLETDLDALRGELVAVIRGTMQPASVALSLRPQDGAWNGRT